MKKMIKEFSWLIRKFTLSRALSHLSWIAALVSITNILIFLFQKRMLDALMQQDFIKTYIYVALYLIGLLFFKLIAWLLSYYKTKKIKLDLRAKIATYLIDCYYKTVKKTDIDKEKTLYVDLLTHYSQIISLNFSEIVSDIEYFFICLMISIVIFYINFQLLVLLIFSCLLYFVVGNIFSKIYWCHFRDYMKKTNKLHAVLEEFISATEEILLYGKQKWEKSKYNHHFGIYFNAAKKINRYGNLQYAMTNLLMYLLMLITIIYCGNLCINGSMAISTFVILYQLCKQLISLSNALFLSLIDFSKVGVQISKIHELDITHMEEKITFFENGSIETIEIKDGSFCYEENCENTLSNINLMLGVNEKIGIIGKSGCGKSTLIKILYGGLHLTKGKLLVNDTAMDEHKFEIYKPQIHLCSQDPYIFCDTVINNILLGRDIPLDRVKEVCEAVEIREFIEKLPNGFDEQISDRGTNISGGQKQRICLARALLGSFDVLILDESTSALDVITEKKIMKYIDCLTNCGKLVIVVAHRLEIIRNANKIFYIANGKSNLIREYSILEERILNDGEG